MAISGETPFIADLHTNSNETVVMTEFAIPDNAITSINLEVVARATVTGVATKFTLSGIASRVSGGAPVVNTTKGTQIGSSTLGPANVTITAGPSFTIFVNVSGVTAIPCDWAIVGTTRALFA